MSDSIQIREGQTRDLPAIYQIWQTEMKNALPGITLQGNYESYFLSKLESQSNPFRVWVAENANGEILGWISLSPLINNPVIRDAFAEVSMYIAEGSQRSGAGNSLAKKAIDYACKNSSLVALVAFIHSGNIAAISLTTKNGFKAAGSLPDFSNTTPPIPAMNLFVRRIDRG